MSRTRPSWLRGWGRKSGPGPEPGKDSHNHHSLTICCCSLTTNTS